MTSPVSAIEAIEKAMESVTHAPGVWEAEGTAVYCDDKTGQRVASTQGQYLLWTEDQKRANARYIAACSPVAMREVLSLALQAEVLQRENAELRDVMKECHTALKMMISPGDISGSTVLGAFAAAKSAEARARALLGGSENAE